MPTPSSQNFRSVRFSLLLLATLLMVSTTSLSAQAASITLDKTVGLDPNLCADANTLEISPGTFVIYCYTVTNNGSVALDNHDLADSELGTLLDGFSFDLAPLESAFLTAGATIFDDTTNIATWLATDTDSGASANATDSATVFIAGGGAGGGGPDGPNPTAAIPTMTTLGQLGFAALVGLAAVALIRRTFSG